MTKRMTKDQRVELLLHTLGPCLAKSKGDYLGTRYITGWGVKTTTELRETIKRIMYDTDLPINTSKEE